MDNRTSVCENDQEKKLQKTYFDVLGLCCSSEVILVERLLKNLEGVKDVQVIITTKTVIVLHDSLLVSDFQIVKALNQAKLEASIRMKGAKTYKNKWPNKFAIGSGICLSLSFLRYIYPPLGWLALVAVAIGIYPIATKAIMGLRNKTLNINSLVLIAVGGSIALQDYWEAGTIVFLFTIAEWLESRASHKATAAMSSLANLVPQRAVLAETGEEVQVGEVKVNTLLAVKEGEVIPIDGVITEGSCEIDEKTLTGESFPVSKERDSDVWAGTININGYVVIKTVVVAEDCVVARMTKLVEEAQSNKSRVERYIETCAKYYTPAIFLISIGIAAIPAALRVDNVRHFYRLAIVVLVGACPCALVLSTPVAMCCALIRASAFGVFFKGGQYVEALAKVKTIAFDKTGTITRGEFEVTEFKPLVDDFDLTTLLYWVSSIERKSSHPLAAAVVDYAESSNSIEPQPHRVEEFHNYVGEGIYGVIDGKQIYIGNHKIANRAGCQSVPKLEGNIVNGKSIGYVFIESRAVGLFCLSDVCRTGVKEALRQLKSLGIKTAMLTGDCQSAAQHVQDQLGGYPEVVHSELLPEDKAKIIKEFQQKGFTAMTGDGINDAPAMATADVGISMGISGSSLAVETAHIILMTNDIQRIPQVIKLARKVKWKIIQNIFISILPKIAIICLAIAGHPLVWAAVLADVGTCLVVILNSMLLLRGMPSHGHSHHHHHKTCCNNDKSEQINGCDSHEAPCAMDCSHESKSNLLTSTCNISPHHHHHHHHHKIAGKDDKPQLIKGCESHKACCNDDKQEQINGCDSHDPSHAIDSSHGTCYTSPHHHDHHHHHHKTCCNDDKPQHIDGCDSHKNCCNDDKPQKSSGCDSHDEASFDMDCSHESKSNTLSSSCCTSDTSDCKTSQCNAHHIHETISLNNVCCSAIIHEPSVKHVEHHVSIVNKSNGDKEVDNEHGCSSSDTSPHHVSDKQARTNHSCSIHTKNNAHLRCKIHVDTRKNDHHHHHHHGGSCGAVKSCGNKEKKHLNSCCEDFRRECCINHGHLKDKFRGGLSEIVVVE